MLANRYWDHLFKKKIWSFSRKHLISAGHLILRPSSEETGTEGISWKKQSIWGGHHIPRPFLEGKTGGVFVIKSLNMSWPIDIEIIFSKKICSFSMKHLIWAGHPILRSSSEETGPECISKKKQ